MFNTCRSITVIALGVVALESFAAGAALLLGLFFYDAFFVFQARVLDCHPAPIRLPGEEPVPTLACRARSLPLRALSLSPQSDVMITVATQLEAPAKLLFAAARETGDGRYPFSVLGLGDLVVPGAFVSLLRQADLDGLGAAAARPAPGGGDPLQKPTPYFNAGMAAYALGLGLTFGACLFISGAARPTAPAPSPHRRR